MAPLGVAGDAYGWQDAAKAIAAIVSPLQDEVEGTDAIGGKGLGEHWGGPVAEKYQEVWGQRYQRYQHLLRMAGQATGPISDFGGQLDGFQKRAQQMESHYTGHGLHLTLDGTRFQLPPSHPSLPQELKGFLEGLLFEAERELDTLWGDIRRGVDDLEAALKPLAGDLEHLAFALSPIGIFWAANVTFDYLRDEAKNHPFELLGHLVLDPMHHLGKDIVEEGKKTVEYKNWRALKQAEKIVDRDSSGYLDSLRGDVERGVSEAADEAGVKSLTAVEWLGRAAGVGAVAITAIQTGIDIKHDGLVKGLEANAGGWAGLAAGLVLGAALGPSLGAIAVVAIVSVGVSAIVQKEVNAHPKGVGKFLTGVGHEAENLFDPSAS